MNFLLLGHQRGGTSFFLDLLRHNSNVDTINEPFSMHIDFFRENEETWSSNEYDKGYLHKLLQDKPNTQSFIKELALWMNSNTERVVGIKETALFEKYYWLVEALQINKTVILIRDPRAVYYSVIKRNMQNSWWKYKDKLIKYYDYRGIDVDSELEVVCNLIKNRYENLYKICCDDSKDILTIKLEDILESTDYYMEKVMNFLGLTFDSCQKDFFSKTQVETRNSTYSNYRKKEDVLDEWKRNIEKTDREKIDRIFEDINIRFKYI